MKSQDIQVSVCVVTYNQEKYIAECLESLVTQQTNFKFEIIVGEDGSTDATRGIVQKYVEQYPNLIVPLFHEKNIGPVENLKQVYLKAKGKYIAHMDGDDLALPNKLQKQFDALEENLDCNICTHNMIRIDTDSIDQKKDWVYEQGIYELINLYEKMPFFAHSSKMLRNKYTKEYWRELLNHAEVLDIDIHVANCIDGNIIHLDTKLGSYRIDVGVSLISHKLNPAVVKGKIRVFDFGLDFYRLEKIKYEKMKKNYAYALLECAYSYALYESNVLKFKEYVLKSFKMKFIGAIQIYFLIGLIFPMIFFKLLRLKK